MYFPRRTGNEAKSVLETAVAFKYEILREAANTILIRIGKGKEILELYASRGKSQIPVSYQVIVTVRRLVA